MPDQDHSPAFWQSVATTFKSDPAVVFDLFNEPYDPTDPRSGDDQNASDKVSWNCWETGRKRARRRQPCFTAAYNEKRAKTSTYQVAGMQTLLNAVRATGATQPVMVGGSRLRQRPRPSWADHAPDDPLNQEAASFHNYMGKSATTSACWNSQIAPVAANVPVVTGEFDEDNFTEPTCAARPCPRSTHEYMNWADPTASATWPGVGW